VIYNIIYIVHQFRSHIGEFVGTILFLVLGHNIDMADKLITFIFSIGAGLFVHILKEINIGHLIVNLFRKKNDNKKD
jgi:hypothetical protein